MVALVLERGYQACVIATPDGRKFIDIPALAVQTGYPVRSGYKNPGDPDVLPNPDALLVVPATVNTINKWAAGIADTLALGLLVEGQGKGLPIVAMPFTNEAMGRHPMFLANLDKLAGWGVTIVFGDDVMPLPAPGDGDAYRENFPWRLAADELEKALPA